MAKFNRMAVFNFTYSPKQGYEHLARPSSQFTTPVAPGKKMREWETLVKFAVNLSRLDVNINMSNVMGNCL